MITNILYLDTTAYLLLVRLQVKLRIVRFFRFISFTGDGYCFPVAMFVIYLLDESQIAASLSSCILAFGLELPLFIILKKAFKRHRPFNQITGQCPIVQPSDEFSFPSGHSAAAFLMATQISCFYPALSPLLFLWASLVGLSRVILGVHYPLDIFFGALLGIACSLLSLISLSLI